MKQHDNDNDELSFVSLAVATANVVRYLGLDEKKDEHSNEKRSSSDDDEKRALERLKFVNRRLRDLSNFEDRARGKKRI